MYALQRSPLVRTCEMCLLGQTTLALYASTISSCSHSVPEPLRSTSSGGMGMMVASEKTKGWMYLRHTPTYRTATVRLWQLYDCAHSLHRPAVFIFIGIVLGPVLHSMRAGLSSCRP